MDELPPGDPADPLADIYGLPNTLKQWRGALGWSQDDLSRATHPFGGVSQRAISFIEQGKVRAQDGTLLILAQTFAQEVDLNPNQLLKDLKSARDHKPQVNASPFALKLDNLLRALPPRIRVLMEELLLQHYYDILRALEHARLIRRTTKSGNQKTPVSVESDDAL